MTTVSLCITILNEEHTINQLITAIANQTRLPDEVVIVDGGSSDTTRNVVEQALFDVEYSTCKNTELVFSGKIARGKTVVPVRFLQVVGNRSVGRNYAIATAVHDWIAITDAGCLPQPSWLEELLTAQAHTDSLVIAGYYNAIVRTDFEEAMVPYVLVMPDRVDPHSFLPATRSMMLHKSIWERAGGFDEQLADNEDYAFAKTIARLTPISFTKAAIVSWIPRQTIGQFYNMVYRFARGDMQAGLIRPKVLLIFLRYLLIIPFILLFCIAHSSLTVSIIVLALLAAGYALWAIAKNYRYVPHGWYWLPILQFSADAAVMSGSIAGVLRRGAYVKKP